jgi:hypothetical protein
MAINPLLFSAGATQAAQTPQTQPMTPEQAYLENMRKISSGDLKSLLTGGDRLLALSALLGSVARGSRTTPQEAMAQVQQTAANRVNMQMQMAQLQAKAAEDARLKADQQTFISKLPAKLQDTAKALRGESLDSFIKNLRINASYKRVIEDGKPVTKVVYGSGLEETADFQIPADSEKMFVNGKPIWVYKDTRTPVIDPATGQPLSAGDPMTPEEMARLAQGQARIDIARANANRPRGGGGGGGGGTLPEPKMVVIDGKPVMAQWDKRLQRYVPFGRQNVSKPNANPFGGILSGGAGSPLFGQ